MGDCESKHPALATHQAEQVHTVDTELATHVRNVVVLRRRGLLRHHDPAFDLGQRNDVRIRRLIRALWVEQVRIPCLNRRARLLDLAGNRDEQSAVLLRSCPPFGSADGVDLFPHERDGETTLLFDQRLDALIERPEDIHGVIPRLPVHEEARIERVDLRLGHLLAVVRARRACARLAEFGPQLLHVIELQIQVATGVDRRDAVGVERFEDQL